MHFNNEISMNKIPKVLYTLIYILIIAVVIGSILSLVRNTESRFLKYLDFPRIQFFVVSTSCIVIGVLVI